jgi:hypothetical protein
MIEAVNLYWGTLAGFFLGFVFGVGCALAVMYSIYMGGYRAAASDATLETPPERWVRARTKALSDAAKAKAAKG